MIRYRDRAGEMPPSGTEAHEGSRLEFGNIVRRRWILLMGWLAVGWGAAAAYWRYTPPTYESSAQVLVMRKAPQLPLAGSQAAPYEGDISGDLLATHMQIIQSPQIVEDALVANGLNELPSITSVLDDGQTAAQYVIDNLAVTRGGGGQAKEAHVLKVAFRHGSSEEARQVVEAIVASYRRFLTETFQDVNQEAAELITRESQELERDLTQAEAEYLESRRQTPLLWKGTESTNVHRAQYEQIHQELSDVRLRAAEARSQLGSVTAALEALDETDASPLELLALLDEKSITRISVFKEAETAKLLALQPALTEEVRAEYSTLLTLLAKEETLRQEFGPNHPELISVREQIDVVRGFMEEKQEESPSHEGLLETLEPRPLLAAYVRLLQHELATLELRETELVALAEREEDAAKTLVAFEMEDETRRSQIDRKRERYNAVIDKVREFNLAMDSGGLIHEVIAPAEAGIEVWPNLLLCLAVGTFAGLVLGAGSATMAELRDGSFRSPEEIVRTLEVPVVAQLRNVRRSGPRRAAGPVSAELCTFHRPTSPESEAFRGLRTALFIASQTGEFRVYECTSPRQGDGKTLMTVNLAVSMAQAGKQVLVVDADLRRPRVHEVLGMDNAVGLSRVLLGEADPWDAVRPTVVERLSVLTAGPTPENPAELLESEGFRELVELARDRFDFVLIDTPPVLAVSDPCIVAPRADAVLLVVRVSSDTRGQALAAAELLAGVDANLTGVVVNGWDAGTRFQYGGAAYGSYGYRGRAATPYGTSRASTAAERRNGEEPAHAQGNGQGA